MIETVELLDEAATRALGAQLVGQLAVGDVVLLVGELGAGKTTLVRGALRALGWIGEVRSPTYNILAEYETSPPVLHADLYRLPSDSPNLDIDEAIEGRISFIEWADRQMRLLSAAKLKVSIWFAGDHRIADVEWLS